MNIIKLPSFSLAAEHLFSRVGTLGTFPGLSLRGYTKCGESNLVAVVLVEMAFFKENKRQEAHDVC